MGAFLLDDVLRTLHCGTISSTVLHPHPGKENLIFIGNLQILEKLRFLLRIFQLKMNISILSQAGILVGLGAAPMWASKATYLTQLGQVYAKITDQAVEAIIVRFFGFFFLGNFP